jgi:dCMP deaminase
VRQDHIIQSRIREIFYMSDKHAEKSSTIGSKRMLDAAGEKYLQLVPRHKQLLINFEGIDWDADVKAPPTPKKNGV